MSFSLPKKTTGSNRSLIREVAERGEKIPDFISLAIGNPSSEAIPVKNITEAYAKVLAENPIRVLGYGPARGSEELISWIKDRLVNQKNFKEKDHDVMIVTGSSQALGLIARVFLDPDDEVYVEQFSYPSGYNAVISAGAKAVSVAADEKGMIPAALEEAAKSGKGKYIYLNPTFQNPTGFTMPLDRRKELYEVAQKYDLLIYEDDPYGEIRFKGEPVSCFKNIDTDDRVLFVGSFSKVLAAGLRVGYIYANEKYIKPLRVVKDSMDGETPLLNQLVIAEVLKNMDFEAHLVEVRKIYKRKYEVMRNALLQYCSDKVKISDPDGGMFIWVELPEDTDMDAFYEAMFKAAVGAVKSEGFTVDTTKPGHAFRINFTAFDDHVLEAGARRFGEVTKYILD